MYALVLSVMFLSISHFAAAQDGGDARIDSLAKVYVKQETAKDEQRKNSDNLSDLKSDRKETRAKAKQAKRVAADADGAARESKMAYRKERKAQKARKQADKQTKKAADARTKSERN